jgi:hypothetical protein
MKCLTIFQIDVDCYQPCLLHVNICIKCPVLHVTLRIPCITSCSVVICVNSALCRGYIRNVRNVKCMQFGKAVMQTEDQIM